MLTILTFWDHDQNVHTILTHAVLVVDLQRQRIDQLRLEFCEEQSTLVNEFETERALICAQHNLEVQELQDIMYAMDQSFDDRDAEAHAEFQSQRDEVKNKVTSLSLFEPTISLYGNKVSWLLLSSFKRSPGWHSLLLPQRTEGDHRDTFVLRGWRLYDTIEEFNVD